VHDGPSGGTHQRDQGHRGGDVLPRANALLVEDFLSLRSGGIGISWLT
jgi:hypothetical protein